MTEISAHIRLRPTRIGFLVKPTDLSSIKKIMSFNACVWGGDFNPIIPVYQTPPKEWRADKHERVRGLSVARGYIDFFEPDVYVETQKGMLEKSDLESLRDRISINPHVCDLNEFLHIRDYRDFSEPFFGLAVTDIFRYLYKTEQRFQKRDIRQSIIVEPDENSGLVEAIFGCYPKIKHAKYFRKGYEDVFLPDKCEVSPQTWLRVFKDGDGSPLRVTRHGLDFPRYWYHDPTIYVFDPSCPTDLIDLWNMRIEPYPVLPVPINWVSELSDFLRFVLKNQHRSVQGNPNGEMHRCTIEIGRSIEKEVADEAVKSLTEDIPRSAIIKKYWRNRIWEKQDEEFVSGHEMIRVTALEDRKSLALTKKQEMITARFEVKTPEFASRYGGNYFRWVNAVQVGAFGPEKVATVLPYNTYNREWPRLSFGGDRIIIGSEGWVFGQRFKNSDRVLNLLTKEDAIVGALKQLGIDAKLSDPGHIAKQVLDHLGGLLDVQYIANTEIVKMINKMAMSVRRKDNIEGSLEEYFAGRTAPVRSWKRLVEGNGEGGSIRNPKVKDYTDRNVIRLGIETQCPHCRGRNWHDLEAVSYTVSCERCLNDYEFPQADGKAREWKYRVVGPFSIPDYARGAYSALLTLRAIDQVGGGHIGEMTFSTAMDMKFNNVECEVDFVALLRKERIDKHFPPELVIGESKSFGEGELIRPKDLKKLRHMAGKIPGAIVVISVMRDHFTENEKKIITQFVKWASRVNKWGRVTNPVVLLTGHELFFDLHVNMAWKNLGRPFSEFLDYEHTKDLYSLAQATQAIYLGMPSFFKRRA